MSKVFQEKEATPLELDEMYDDFPSHYTEARSSIRSHESAASVSSTSELPKKRFCKCRMTADCFGFIFIMTAIFAVTTVATIFIYQMIHCGSIKPLTVCGSGMETTSAIKTAQKDLPMAILPRIENIDNKTVTDSHSNETAQIFIAVAKHPEMLSSHNSSKMNDTVN